jgi:hypothetical protein
MPSAIDVTPAKWSAPAVLFDNGDYSVISGLYDDGAHRVLGERWNGAAGALGFPNQGGNPIWHVVPDFLAIPLLHGILDELLNTGTRTSVDAVIQELTEQHRIRGTSASS